jgi:hypothetical protein
MRSSDRRAQAMRLRAAGAMAFAALVGVAACGRRDSGVRDSAGPDTARVSAMPDTAAPPRVVPYNPSAPGPMRSGDEPIKAAPAPVGATTGTAPSPAQGTAGAKPSKPTTPTTAVKPSADSIGDPATIVRDYYAAIRAHDFLRAYRMWGSGGQSGVRSYAQFEAGFDSTETVDAKIGAPGRVEGAAGSRFVTVPLEIDARLRNGTRQRFTGTYTLRRVVVPGASAAQRRWHLYAANIRQVQ